MLRDKKKVIVLDDQDGPQFFYSGEIRDIIDNPERIIKCRSLEEVERKVAKAQAGEIEIAVVLADIEIFDRANDSLPGRDHGLQAAELLINHMVPAGQRQGQPQDVPNYVIISRYLEDCEVYEAVQKLERTLNVYLPNKIERPVGVKVFQDIIGNVFQTVGIKRI